MSNTSAEREFTRVNDAGRGSIRVECGDYVVLGHCATADYVGSHTAKTWFISVYHDDRLVSRHERNNLDYGTFASWCSERCTGK